MIDAIDLDMSTRDLFELSAPESKWNGVSVQILDERNAIPSAKFETRLKMPYSLRPRSEGIEPMMQRISIEYEHTSTNGTKDRYKVEGEFAKNDDHDKNDSTVNNENNSRASDIDSTDRDHDKDNG